MNNIGKGSAIRSINSRRRAINVQSCIAERGYIPGNVSLGNFVIMETS